MSTTTVYALSIWDSYQSRGGGYELTAIYESEAEARAEAARLDAKQRDWLKKYAPNASPYAFTPCNVCPVKFVRQQA